MTNRTVSRADIEAALWKWSAWQADQRAVDDVMRLVDAYTPASEPTACHVPDWRGKPVAVDQTCPHVAPAQLRPWTFDDLPETEQERFLKLMKARETAAYQRGQDAALKDGAPRPVDALSGGHATDVIVDGYRAPDGGLWVRLGVVRERMARASNRWKACSTCHKEKPLTSFRKDTSAKTRGREVLRAQCKDCESSRRKERYRNKSDA